MSDQRRQAAKDVPDAAVLEAIRQNIRSRGICVLGACLWEIQELLPLFHPKVVHAKLRSMRRRGLISGCACGCRGDFNIIVVEEKS